MSSKWWHQLLGWLWAVSRWLQTDEDIVRGVQAGRISSYPVKTEEWICEGRTCWLGWERRTQKCSEKRVKSHAWVDMLMEPVYWSVAGEGHQEAPMGEVHALYSTIEVGCRKMSRNFSCLGCGFILSNSCGNAHFAVFHQGQPSMTANENAQSYWHHSTFFHLAVFLWKR